MIPYPFNGNVRFFPATPAKVQLIVNDGARQGCWEATYSAFTTADGERFKAKSD